MKEVIFYAGELPRPTRTSFYDEDGALDTTITGTVTAKTKIDSESEVDVTCTNNLDGTVDLDWPRSPDPTVFVMPTGKTRSLMRIDFLHDDGSGDEYLGRETVKVHTR